MPAMSELKTDMENLKRHGFNLVKLQEHWAVDEPVEGTCDFSRYHELIECAARLDLGVYVGLTCEQAPPWLWEKYPDCRMVGRDGKGVAYQATSTLPADGKPGPCFDHDGARADMLRFIRLLVEELGRHENIVVWNTWQEVGYWSEGLLGATVCYCGNTLRAFRDWLRVRYGDLDGLNRAWNTRNRDWRHVGPDMRPLGKTCLPNDVDWNYFMDNVQVARVLRERCRVIKEADSGSRPVFAHKAMPAIGSGADWTSARCQDWLGSSCYPAWGPVQAWDDVRPPSSGRFDSSEALLAEMWDGIALRFDYLRSSNPPGLPVWAAEFQGGPVSTGLHRGRVPSAADMRRWMLTSIGSGVTAISFWVTRAEIAAAETNGFSLLDSEGDSTERYEEAARVGAALDSNRDLFAQPTLEPAPVGILVNEWNWQLCRSMDDAAEHLSYSVRGWHRLLWELGIPVDFVELSTLGESPAAQPRLLVLPFPLSISEDAVGRLESFVSAGGTLVSEACLGRLSEHAFANRGDLSPAARELFGVRHRALTMVREPGDSARWMPRERMWGEFHEPALLAGTGLLSGEELRANLYIETFDCITSEPVLLHAGQPSGTARTLGTGRAWLLGTLLGHAGTAHRIPQTSSLVRRIAASAGVEPVHPGRLLLRRRRSGTREAFIVTNPTPGPLTEIVAVGRYREARDLLGDAVEHVPGGVRLTVGSLNVRVVIVER
jgi:beta-galactosidase